ncbi:MAG: NUC169 domain-containing protein [Monoraphidium minutum]|nr:MAG: NUC169 domain-containing protein [Monoraphidium minutum]
MPKRGKAGEGAQKPAAPVELEDDLPVADLDLDSEEEELLADDEIESGSEDDGSGSESDDEVRAALADYMRAAAAERPARAKGDGGRASTSGDDSGGGSGDEEEDGEGKEGAAAGGKKSGRRRAAAGGGGQQQQQQNGDGDGGGDGEGAVDPGSDSSEDERPNRNTIGNVPLGWYKAEDHIGYDTEGQKLLRRERKDKLDALLARSDGGAALRTIYDDYNDEEIVLSKEEIKMLMRIRRGQFPHLEVDPYPDYEAWADDEVDPHPLLNAPEPKRRFIPSKWEEKKVVKLVRAIRNGWLKTRKQKREEARKEAEVYMLWGDDDQVASKTGAGLTHIPAAKPKLPGHEESYNPPREYLPTEEEKTSWQLLDEEERPKFVPAAYASLREVPMYGAFIQEQFERCLDLYLCPRVRKKRLHVNPESLVPKLPKPQDLQPFPTRLAVRYSGHAGKVRCLAPHAGGQWLATGGQDGTLRLWEVVTGRCTRTWQLGGPVVSLAWCPNPELQLLSAAVGSRVVLLPSGLGGPAVDAAAAAALQLPVTPKGTDKDAAPLAAWTARPDGGVDVAARHPVTHVTWHGRGDYFASVAPTGATQSVLVHQLSKRASQNPFRKNRGRVTRAAFHPVKPFFFVATQNHVRVYNLAKQALAKKLIGGGGAITCLAVHPGGDHVIVGGDDKRLAWYDLDLAATPYRALRYHSQPLTGAAFHASYPLFASSSDDGSVHVFHGRVYADLLTNPLIVPVKVLRGHKVVDSAGVTDVAFHPTQPWLFSAGGDGDALLFCN